MALVACPFCREMFERTEAKTCPVCGVPLRPFQDLPPSPEALEQDGVARSPELEPLPPTYMGRGRGVLAFLSCVGLGVFFGPWIHVIIPDDVVLSGFDLARRLGWSWGAGIAWFVLLPTLLSRRTIVELRGARVAVAFLSAVPAATVIILLSKPPKGGLVPIRFSYDWCLYATLVVSVVAFVASLRLGGRPDDIRVVKGTSSGQTLH